MANDTTELTKPDEKALARQRQEDAMVDNLTKLLPQHLDQKRFIALALAMYRDPNLRDCTNQSKMLALADCAKLGLIPDRNLGHVWLVPFNNKFLDPTDKKWKSRKEVTLIPGYQGYIELARRSGLVTNVHTWLVREGDGFQYWIDENGPHLRHDPCADSDAEITDVYCIAKLKDGTPQIEKMTMAQVLKVKAESKAGDKGPWKDWFEEMVRKTCVRRARKYWPQSAELAQLGAFDDYADGIVERKHVDNVAVGGLASAPEGRVNLSASVPDPEPTPLETKPEDQTDGNNKKPDTQKKKTKTKTTKKEAVEEPTEPPQEEQQQSDIPVDAKGRLQWLTKQAMGSCDFDDETVAQPVVTRWVMAASIAPSQLNQDSIFNNTKAMTEKVDWQPLFDKYIEEGVKADKAKKDG